MTLDVPQPVMAAMSAAGSKAQLAQRQVDIVADHQQIGEDRLVEVNDLANALTAQVHEGLGLDEENLLAILVELGDPGLKAILKTAHSRATGQAVHHHEADIVPRVRVPPAGIAQAYDDFHGQAR